MDIFKFTNLDNPTKMEKGQIVNGLKSKLWIERYRDSGEFELVADAEKEMTKILPVGTFISHIDSTDIMVVENHEIIDNQDKQTEIKITGRSFESFLENRIVGSNKDWPTEASGPDKYVLLAGTTYGQAVILIKEHIYPLYLYDVDDTIEYVEVLSNITTPEDPVAKTIQRGSVYTRLIELLNINDLGIKVVRPGINSPLGSGSQNTAFLIHKGTDLSEEVIFSYTSGELERADYFWSNRNFKNAALVSGRWLENVVKLGSGGYNRRMMLVDGSDLDSSFSSAPTGTDRDDLLLAMWVRGVMSLSAQNELAIIKAEPTKNSTLYQYRKDYTVGDIVTVAGQYNETASMRINEYVEIEDETGESGYPTFSLL